MAETDKILIKKGENVRIILYNGSMMRHPMHLHGQDFRVINGQGDQAPLKMCWTFCRWKPIRLSMLQMQRETGFFIVTFCIT